VQSRKIGKDDGRYALSQFLGNLGYKAEKGGTGHRSGMHWRRGGGDSLSCMGVVELELLSSFKCSSE
jgi:hypothetical protein